MATVALSDYLPLVAAVKKAPQRYLRSSYDAEAAALYISFKKPSVAEDGEMTEDDVILRYEGDEIIGLTILHAFRRVNNS